MTTLYTSDLDSETLNAQATGWVNKVGTWQVRNLNPISGAQAYGSSTAVDGDVALYTALAARADMGWQTDQKLATLTSTTIPIMGHVLRMDSSYQNGYTILLNHAGTGGQIKAMVFKRVSGSYTSILTSGTLVTAALNDTLHFRSTIVGNVINIYVWLNGASMPGTPSATVTNSSISAAGYPGFYYALDGASTGTTMAVDNIVYDDAAAAAAATAITLTNASPNSGPVGVASNNFTVGANGAISGTVVVTPSDGGAGGAFTPTSVSISSGSPTGTFTYTPTTPTGAKTISVINNGGLTNPSSMTYTATAGATTIPVDDANLIWSPYNWDTLQIGDFGVATKSMQTACCGAYLRFKVTGTTSIALSVDTSTLSGFGANVPFLRVITNGSSAQDVTVTAGATSLTIGSGLTSGASYTVEFYVIGSVEAQGTRWGGAGVSPSNVVRIKGITVDSGGVTQSLALRGGGYGIAFGDSITEGVRAAGTTTQPADHDKSYAWYLATATNCEVGVIGFGATGWQSSGSGSMPAFPNHWNLHSTGRSRSFSPAPTWVTVNHGTNGATSATNVSSWLTAARAAFGSSTWIFIVVPPGGAAKTALQTGVSNYQAGAPSDARVVFVDLSDRIPTAGMTAIGSATYQAVDGLHPYQWMHGMIGAALAQKMTYSIYGAGSAVYPAAGMVLSGNSYGPSGSEYSGTVTIPSAAQVLSGVGFGAAGTQFSGTVTQPAATDVRSGTSYGAGGTATTGNLTLPASGQVQSGVQFGANGTQYTGTLSTGGGTYPAASSVLSGVQFGPSGNDYTGTVTQPAAANVRSGISYGAGGTQYTGTIMLPSAGQVLTGVGFGSAGTQFTGNVTQPSAAQVQAGVQYGASGTQYTGTLATGGADQWDSPIEGSITARQMMRAMGAVLLGRASGAEGNAPVFRAADNSKARVSAVTDASGNRTTVTVDYS